MPTFISFWIIDYSLTLPTSHLNSVNCCLKTFIQLSNSIKTRLHTRSQCNINWRYPRLHVCTKYKKYLMCHAQIALMSVISIAITYKIYQTSVCEMLEECSLYMHKFCYCWPFTCLTHDHITLRSEANVMGVIWSFKIENSIVIFNVVNRENMCGTNISSVGGLVPKMNNKP